MKVQELKLKKEIKELEALLNVECPKYDTNCDACPYLVECDRYIHLLEDLKEV